MKRIFILLMGATVFLSSCNTVRRTARTADTQADLRSATVVDIVPATESRITHTLRPDAALLRGGEANVRQAAEHEALVKYGNADILLEPQYIVHKERRLFRTKILSVTVSGRPAYYTNYRALHDSVWANPVFRGVRVPQPRMAPFGIGAKADPVDLPDAPSAKYNGVRGKGFAVLVAPFVGMKSIYAYDDDYNGFDGRSMAGGVQASAGYQFFPWLFVGAGLGMDFWDGEIGSIPLYINPRIYLSKKDRGLFLDGKVGMNIFPGYGLFSGTSIGYSFGRLDVGYQYLCHEYYINHDYSCDQWTLSVSYRF